MLFGWRQKIQRQIIENLDKLTQNHTTRGKKCMFSYVLCCGWTAPVARADSYCEEIPTWSFHVCCVAPISPVWCIYVGFGSKWVFPFWISIVVISFFSFLLAELKYTGNSTDYWKTRKAPPVIRGSQHVWNYTKFCKQTTPQWICFAVLTELEWAAEGFSLLGFRFNLGLSLMSVFVLKALLRSKTCEKISLSKP